ncbi:MAG: RNA polymerase sigma-I factor [Thermaerobacter sp.]|nr:RNA polymerase sigma-I factor [Thermaerobacter sp.]
MSFLPGTRPAAADVARAQADKAARELLIERFTPFVLRATTRTVGRYVRLGEDDEVSVALIAFNEAIDRFDPERGGNFLAFAETVIKRRLIDHYRREGQRREIPLSALQAEEGDRESQLPMEAEAAISAHQERTAQEERREEILRFQTALNGFGIHFSDLVRLSPRHRDARAAAMGVAALVAGRHELRRYLLERGSLPMRQLEAEVALSRKTLERHRKFIVAVALALCGDYPYLHSYFRTGGDD